MNPSGTRLAGVAAVLVGLVAWALVAERAGPLLLAGPVEVARALVDERARLGEASVRTAVASLGGLGAAALLGVGLAVGAWWSRALRAALLPYTVVLQVVPIVAIAPLLVVWLGYGTGVAITTAILAAFYPVYSAATTGLAAAPRELVDLFALYGAGRARELWLLRLPAALPALFSGLRSAAGLSVIGAIVGEFVGSNGYPPTLGYLVVFAARSARPDLCFAAIACAAALALAQHALLLAVERRAIGRWFGTYPADARDRRPGGDRLIPGDDPLAAPRLLRARACAPPAAAPAPAVQPLSVALNWYPEPEFGGFYEAALSGAYARAGLDVTLVPGGPGVPVLELLAAGKADVAISGADDLLLRRSRGLDAVAVLPGFQDSPLGLMVHAASGVTRFEDVRGRVAIEVGSPFQQYLWSKYGWDGKVEPVPTTGSIGPFAADPALAQQAYITSEPCVAEGQGLAITFLPARTAGWNPYASLAVVRGADRDAPWVRAFHDASLGGWRAYLADPTRANAEISRLNPNVPADRMACIVARQRPFVEGTDGLGAMRAARWEEVAAALRATGQVVDPAGAWIDLGPTPAAPSEAAPSEAAPPSSSAAPTGG